MWGFLTKEPGISIIRSIKSVCVRRITELLHKPREKRYQRSLNANRYSVTEIWHDLIIKSKQPACEGNWRDPHPAIPNPGLSDETVVFPKQCLSVGNRWPPEVLSAFYDLHTMHLLRIDMDRTQWFTHSSIAFPFFPTCPFSCI